MVMPVQPYSKAQQTGGSRYDRKAQRKAQDAAHERTVHQAVDTRDRNCCRVCGHYCSPLAIGLLERSHRHHLIYRSAGGPTTTSNLVTLCSRDHHDEHQHVLRLSGDADARDKATGRLRGVKVERLVDGGWRVEAWV